MVLQWRITVLDDELANWNKEVLHECPLLSEIYAN
jgi:hypothetical protein